MGLLERYGHKRTNDATVGQNLWSRNQVEISTFDGRIAMDKDQINEVKNLAIDFCMLMNYDPMPFRKREPKLQEGSDVKASTNQE